MGLSSTIKELYKYFSLGIPDGIHKLSTMIVHTMNASYGHPVKYATSKTTNFNNSFINEILQISIAAK